MLNKKAAGFFMIIFLVFVIIVVSYGIWIFLGPTAKLDVSKEIGNTQLNILSTYEQAELDLFVLDQVVKYTTYNTINEFSKNGGIDEDCNGIWKFNSDCEPDLKKDFRKSFNKNLESYGYISKEFELENNFIVGKLNDFSYMENEENLNFTYNVSTDFNQESAINITKLENLQQNIEDCLRNKEELSICLKEPFEKEDKTIQFNIESDKKIMVFTDKIEFKNPIFTFKLNLDDTGIETGIF